MNYSSKVGIVIVCMNNLKNLIPCIESIKLHTHDVSYEIWVTCYLFSDDNLKLLKEKYPDVNIIVNNEISGFSENNNLILRQLKTEYALVLNDDTQIHNSMIDILSDDLDKNSNIAIISPVLFYGSGKVQFCGRNPINAWQFLLEDMSIAHLYQRKSKWINKSGLFQTYNVTGACFLVRMDVFKLLGFFDEKYFFCPEDLAFSTLANRSGYECWVNTKASITHYCGQTRANKMKMATLPSQRKGCVLFWGDGSFIKTFILSFLLSFSSLLKSLIWFVRGDKTESVAQLNCVCSLFSKETPKEIFVKYYNKVKKSKK